MSEVATQEKPIEELSQRDYNQARKEGKLTVAVEKPAEEPKEVKEEVQAEVQESEETEETKPEPKKHAGGGFQKRIDRLTKEKAALEERAAAAERRAAELEQFRAKAEPEKPKVDGEPQEKDFTRIEDYLVAKAKYELRQELKAEREAEQAKERQAAANEVWEAHNERLIAAKAKYEDYEEKINAATMPWSMENPSDDDKAAAEAFRVAIFEDENGAEIMYHYAEHPEELEKLGHMSPSQVVKAIARLSDKLTPAEPAKEEKEEKPEPVKSKASPPIKPVGGGATKSSVPLDEMDMASYIKARKAGRIS